MGFVIIIISYDIRINYEDKYLTAIVYLYNNNNIILYYVLLCGKNALMNYPTSTSGLVLATVQND